MRVRYNQLQEAIIKVPKELLDKVNVYVSSYLYFKINQYIKRIDIMLPSTTSPEEKQRVLKDANNSLGKLQKQYGAKNISTQTAEAITNKSINIPFDVETFFQQLSFKGITKDLINLMKGNLTFNLLIKTGNDSPNIGGSQEYITNYSILVTVVARLNDKDMLGSVSKIMSNTYHELQHAVQAMAIKNINPQDKQLQVKDKYSDSVDKTDYYSSGIEYTPQLGNLVDIVIDELEQSVLKDDLNHDKNNAIKNAINSAVQKSTESRKFLTVLYKEDRQKYKKALTYVYKHISPVYDNLKENGIDFSHTDLPEEDLEANVDIMYTVYKTLYNVGNYKVEAFGKSKRHINQLNIISTNAWKIVLSKDNVKKGNYIIRLHGFEPEFEETERLNSKQVLNLFGILRDITWYDATDIIDDLEFITGERKDVSDNSIIDMFTSLKDDAHMMEVPFGYNNTEFNVFGKTFNVQKTKNTTDKVDIQYDDKTLHAWSLKQLLIAFQMMIRFYTVSHDEVLGILNKDNMYVEFVSDLRRL